MTCLELVGWLCFICDLMRSHLSLNQKKSCPNRLHVSLQGFDTISTALSWSVMYLVAYPEIQERLHQEISKYNTVTQNTVKKWDRIINFNLHLHLELTASESFHFQRKLWAWIAHLVSLTDSTYPSWKPSSWKSFAILHSCPSPSLTGEAHRF